MRGFIASRGELSGEVRTAREAAIDVDVAKPPKIRAIDGCTTLPKFGSHAFLEWVATLDGFGHGPCGIDHAVLWASCGLHLWPEQPRKAEPIDDVWQALLLARRMVQLWRSLVANRIGTLCANRYLRYCQRRSRRGRRRRRVVSSATRLTGTTPLASGSRRGHGPDSAAQAFNGWTNAAWQGSGVSPKGVRRSVRAGSHGATGGDAKRAYKAGVYRSLGSGHVRGADCRSDGPVHDGFGQLGVRLGLHIAGSSGSISLASS